MNEEEKLKISAAINYSIQAVKSGELTKAKQALAWVIKRDPKNINAWLLLAEVMDDHNAKTDCYTRVLKLDPNNQVAKDGLDLMDISKPQPEIIDRHDLDVQSDEQILLKEDKRDIPEEQPLTVEEKIEISRRELLDLSLYNKLINYRPLKSRGVEIVDEISSEVFRILVTDGKSMSFLSKPEEEETDLDQEFLIADEELESGEELRQPDEDENGIAARHIDRQLQTPYISKNLQKRLLNTYYSARTYIEEQGVNILYLAIGVLHWYESQSSNIMRQAPLLLIPVELTRSSVRANFRIKYTEEEIGENLSLRAKLLSDFGLIIPDFPDDDEIDILEYTRKIRDSIHSHPRWGVEAEALNLGFFSFGKFLMYNDLDSDN